MSSWQRVVLGPMSVLLFTLNALAQTSNTAITYTDSTTDQVVKVTQNGSGAAVKATTGSATGNAIAGVNTSTTGTTRGVYGESNSSATSAAGVYGISKATTGVNYGVLGLTTSTQGTALNGTATAPTGPTIGLRGQANSTSGIGVQGASTAATGNTTGVNGFVMSPSGTAGYFDNRAGGKILSLRSNSVERVSVDGQGNIVATSFTGNGSGLSNVSALTAVTAVTAGTANMLNGLPASSFVRTDAGNTLTGNQGVMGNVAVTGDVAAGTLHGNGAGLTGLGSNSEIQALIQSQQALIQSQDAVIQALQSRIDSLETSMAVPAGTPFWARGFGGGAGDYVYSIAVDKAGSIYIAGAFSSSTIDFGGGTVSNTSSGSTDAYLAKFDKNGTYLWAKVFGGTQSDYARSVGVDGAGNVYVSGAFLSPSINLGSGPLSNAGLTGNDLFIAKFDMNGNHIWSKTLGGTGDDNGGRIAVDNAGNVYLQAYSNGSIDAGGGVLTSAGSYDVVVAKFDTDGHHLWSRSYGDDGDQSGRYLALDRNGNVFLTGQFNSTVDFGGGPLISAGGYDIYLAKLSTDGAFVWAKRFGGVGNDTGYNLATDGTGSVFLAAYYFSISIDVSGLNLINADSSGSYPDILLAKFDGNGTQLWAKRFGGTNSDFAYGIATDSAGNVYLAGGSSGGIDFGGGAYASNGGSDAFVAKFTPGGVHLSSMSYGGTSYDAFYGLAVDALGTMYLTGNFVNQINFGGDPLAGVGSYDVFVTKIR